MDEHEAAARASGERMRASAAAFERDHDDHLAILMAALKAGKRPTDVASWSEFSAAYLRRVARLRGIPPAVKGNGTAS